jgi:predicted HicB family RNase H-like nuclease
MLETVPKPAGAPADDTTYGALTVRLPRELIDRIKQMARDEERSINYIAARLLRQAIDESTTRVPIPRNP